MTKPQAEISGRDLLTLRYLRDKYGVATVVRELRGLPPRRRGAPKKLRSSSWALVSTIDEIASELRKKGAKAPIKEAQLEALEHERSEGRPISLDTFARRYRRAKSELARKRT